MSESYNHLLDAIYGGASKSRFDPKALDIYRANLRASAGRALSITFPTLEKLIGVDMLAHYATLYLQHEPFNQGDWGLWGGFFSSFLSEQQAGKEYPYLSDVAELEWAIHCTEREEDEAVNSESFSLLSGNDLFLLRISISRHLKIIRSDYPIANILSVNGLERTDELMAETKEMLTQGLGQNIIVYRPQYKAKVDTANNIECDLLESFMSNKSIGDVLNSIEEDFEFESWLMQAVQKKHIVGIVKASSE